jgi:hypothetical protein
MDIANTVATYLQSAGFGTIGSDLFVGYIPDDTNGVWVERIGGTLNYYVPLEESIVNIYVKDTRANEAVDKIEDIKRYIHRMYSVDSTTSYIYTLLVIGDVEDIARDLEYAKVYKITVQVLFRDKTLIS